MNANRARRLELTMDVNEKTQQFLNNPSRSTRADLNSSLTRFEEYMEVSQIADVWRPHLEQNGP